MSCKRPLSSSSLPGDSPDFASVSSLPKPSHQLKKVKVTDTAGQDSSPAMIITDPVHADIRSAIDIKNALDSIDELPQLGYCPTKAQKFCDEYLYYDDEKSMEGGEQDIANQNILDELETVYEDMESLSLSHACGDSQIHSFHLRITRPGCEYNGDIKRDTRKTGTLLPTWFEHSAISGYGDMQSLETKVDPEVRNAREIPASEFEVKPQFLKKIQKLWGEHFIPRNVRAAPYKIHLYGPGGHFKSHRDTPETGLVGTFLVGLGDTSSTPDGNFRIADKKLKADPCSWVAFHPDTPHEITKLEDGYRAVMAFKIFRLANNNQDNDLELAQLGLRVKKILDQIPPPFGLLMAHRYSMGTTSLNGFDALLSAYASSRNDTRAHMLPVVTVFTGEIFDDREHKNVVDSQVFPFTRAHVDILLGKNLARAKEEVRWLDGLEEIPFYTWDLEASMETWEEDHPDGLNYTGNEADSQREDSIYLSYAILFLPQRD